MLRKDCFLQHFLCSPTRVPSSQADSAVGQWARAEEFTPTEPQRALSLPQQTDLMCFMAWSCSEICSSYNALSPTLECNNSQLACLIRGRWKNLVTPIKVVGKLGIHWLADTQPNDKGYAKIPPLKESVAAHLCPSSASGWRARLRPSRAVWHLPWQQNRSQTMVKLLPPIKQWLNLMDIKDANHVALLDSPVSWLFFLLCCRWHEAQKFSQAMRHFLPKRAGPSADASRPKLPPQQQQRVKPGLKLPHSARHAGLRNSTWSPPSETPPDSDTLQPVRHKLHACNPWHLGLDLRSDRKWLLTSIRSPASPF